VLRAPLPAGESLATVPKAWFGEAIFDEQGSIVKGGALCTFCYYRYNTSG